MVLPNEIWLQVLGYLGSVDRARVGAVSQQLYEVANDDKAWRDLYQRDIHRPKGVLPRHAPNGLCWRDCYDIHSMSQLRMRQHKQARRDVEQKRYEARIAPFFFQRLENVGEGLAYGAVAAAAATLGGPLAIGIGGVLGAGSLGAALLTHTGISTCKAVGNVFPHLHRGPRTMLLSGRDASLVVALKSAEAGGYGMLGVLAGGAVAAGAAIYVLVNAGLAALTAPTCVWGYFEKAPARAALKAAQDHEQVARGLSDSAYRESSKIALR